MGGVFQVDCFGYCGDLVVVQVMQVVGVYFQVDVVVLVGIDVQVVGY